MGFMGMANLLGSLAFHSSVQSVRMLQVNSPRIYGDLALTPHSYDHASSRCQRSAVFASSNYTSRQVCQTHSQAAPRRQREEANPEGCACRQGRAVQGPTGCQGRARSSSSCEGTCFSILLHSGPQKYQSYLFISAYGQGQEA